MLKFIPAIPGNLLFDKPVPEIGFDAGMAGWTKQRKVHGNVKLRLALHPAPDGVMRFKDNRQLAAALTGPAAFFNQLLFSLKEVHFVLCKDHVYKLCIRGTGNEFYPSRQSVRNIVYCNGHSDYKTT